MIRDDFLDSISFFINEIENENINWVLTGSYRLYLENKRLIYPKDIDILTDKKGADLIRLKFEEYITTEFELRISNNIKSYFGQLLINGIDIDIMSDVFNKVNSKWLPIPRLRKIDYLFIEQKKIPVFSLETEKEIAETLGQKNKKRIIEKIISQCSGC